MKNGWIKVFAASPEIRPGDCAHNTEKIISAAAIAAEKGAKLAVFPELCVTGSTCGDLFFQDFLIKSAAESIEKIKEYSNNLDLLIIFGVPVKYFEKLYNCAIAVCKGNILAAVPKTNLSAQELRYFSNYFPNNNTIVLRNKNLPDFMVGIEFGETFSNFSPNIVASLSADSEIIGRAQRRREFIKSRSRGNICGYVLANAGKGESTTDMVFSGHNIIAENGVILKQNKLFENEPIISEIDINALSSERQKNISFKPKSENINIIEFSLPLTDTKLTRSYSMSPFVPKDPYELKERCQLVLQIQAEGLKKRLKTTNSRRMIIGVSGGIDSAAALLAICDTADSLSRPRSDILALSMPCFGTSARTKSNAQKLCESLGVKFKEIDITESVRSHFSDIGQNEKVYDITFENSQSRERTQVLMDTANKENGLVIGTGDLSELALGWSTYNGDHMSMYGINSSVPKTLIRHIVKHYSYETKNQELKNVLIEILDTPISPELLPSNEISQKTETIIGPYELHDFFLYYTVRRGFSPAKILLLTEYAFNHKYSRKTIEKWQKMFYTRFFSQQYKRSCLPDGPTVGTVSLSPREGLKMPSDLEIIEIF
ncbi:MAG: NAD(+) synthase [Eubacterium sp.]|nr:NAD(+) synthase [Eubacterium sp.]